jgi:NTE family protein
MILQGGGALGAYEYGVIRALYEQPDFKLDVVTGVSIGAINAAMLVSATDKEDAIRKLDALWRERFAVREGWWLMPQMQRYVSLLNNPGMYRIRPDYFAAPLVAPFMETSIYDTSPLRQTLSEFVDLQQLNKSSIRMAVSAVNVVTGEIMYFRNTDEEQISLDHLIASASLAPGFPMTGVINPRTGMRQWYWDGGFYSNLPLSEAINLLEQIDGDQEDVERELIVVELFPMRAKLPADLIDVQNRLVALQFSSKLDLDETWFHKVDDFVDLFQQIDQELQPDSKAREMPGYQEMKKHKKINNFLKITSSLPESGAAGDFSIASIERRIDAGYENTLKQLKQLSAV